ncbi:MAG: Nif11-like leader peptide family natural product precursor [Desulfohalobiaceae bacterium]
MSIVQAQAFIEKVKNDEDLAKRLSETQDSESKLEIARQEGFEFMVEELNSAKQTLSEEDLYNVASGAPSWMFCFLSADCPIQVDIKN